MREENKKQLTIRVSADLHRRVKVKAAEDGVSISEVIRRKLEGWVDGDDSSSAA